MFFRHSAYNLTQQACFKKDLLCLSKKIVWCLTAFTLHYRIKVKTALISFFFGKSLLSVKVAIFVLCSNLVTYSIETLYSIKSKYYTLWFKKELWYNHLNTNFTFESNTQSILAIHVTFSRLPYTKPVLEKAAIAVLLNEIFISFQRLNPYYS